MNNNVRAFSTLLFALGLLLITAELNNWLSAYALSLNLDILLVLFCGLYLRILHGWWIAILIGLLVDAGRPTAIGFNVGGLILLWMLVVYTRRQIHRESPAQIIVTSVSLQFLWLLLLSLYLSEGRLGDGAFWQRFFLDGALSLGAVLLVAWPWCELQRLYLKWSGWDLKAEIRRV